MAGFSRMTLGDSWYGDGMLGSKSWSLLVDWSQRLRKLTDYGLRGRSLLSQRKMGSW